MAEDNIIVISARAKSAKGSRDKAKKPSKSGQQTTLSHPNLNRQYNANLADKICEQIANGLSYPQVQKMMPDAPSWHVLLKWRTENKDFDRLYRLARLAQAEHFVDQIIDIADNSRDAALAAVRIKSRQWLAAKRLPQVYGDSIKLELEDTNQPQMTPFEAARRLAFALAQQGNSPIIDSMSQANQPEVSKITGSRPADDENDP